MHFSFSKYEGAGNDFILVDNRSLFFPVEDSSFIARLCHRQKGIGADGLILLQDAQKQEADFRMRIFNADGKEATMCGNGLRCLVLFIHKLTQGNYASLAIETPLHIHHCSLASGKIFTSFAPPKTLHWELMLEGKQLYVVDTGVPHAVLFESDLDKAAVSELGRRIRYHPTLAPEGANVNFVQRLSPHALLCRTYERGVEAETLSCGTGAVAAALVASRLGYVSSPIALHTRTGEVLEIALEGDSPSLAGPAHAIFEGMIRA